MSYGMLGYVVPHSIYPDGYHCKPETPLPFMNVASQKNFMRVEGKLDMGKSCVRFKKLDKIPYDLIGELCTKMPVDNWIKLYEKNIKKK